MEFKRSAPGSHSAAAGDKVLAVVAGIARVDFNRLRNVVGHGKAGVGVGVLDLECVARHVVESPLGGQRIDVAVGQVNTVARRAGQVVARAANAPATLERFLLPHVSLLPVKLEFKVTSAAAVVKTVLLRRNALQFIRINTVVCVGIVG